MNGASKRVVLCESVGACLVHNWCDQFNRSALAGPSSFNNIPKFVRVVIICLNIYYHNRRPFAWVSIDLASSNARTNLITSERSHHIIDGKSHIGQTNSSNVPLALIQLIRLAFCPRVWQSSLQVRHLSGLTVNRVGLCCAARELNCSSATALATDLFQLNISIQTVHHLYALSINFVGDWLLT